MGKRAKKKDHVPAVGDKPFLYVQLRTFAHASEDRAKVESAMAVSAHLDLGDATAAERFQALLSASVTTGHFHNPIHILEVEITRAREVRHFWDGLFATHGVAERLLDESEARLDDDLVLWFRIDKQQAARGTVALSRGEDVIHVRAKLATYPKDRTVALAWLRNFLAEGVATAPTTQTA